MSITDLPDAQPADELAARRRTTTARLGEISAELGELRDELTTIATLQAIAIGVALGLGFLILTQKGGSK